MNLKYIFSVSKIRSFTLAAREAQQSPAAYWTFSHNLTFWMGAGRNKAGAAFIWWKLEVLVFRIDDIEYPSLWVWIMIQLIFLGRRIIYQLWPVNIEQLYLNLQSRDRNDLRPLPILIYTYLESCVPYCRQSATLQLKQ